MTKRWLALMVACLALGVAAGCGGSDSSNDNSSNGGGGGGGGTTAPAEPAPAAKGGSGDVTMKDIKFHPDKVTIKTGQTVVWTNEDSVGHDVTSYTDGGLARNTQYSYRVRAFNAGGVSAYSNVATGKTRRN